MGTIRKSWILLKPWLTDQVLALTLGQPASAGYNWWSPGLQPGSQTHIAGDLNHLKGQLWAENKRKKEYDLKAWEKENSNTVSLKRKMKRQRNIL